MNDLFAHPLWQRLALVLLHSLWQGALIGLVAWIVLDWLRPRRAEVRYLVGVGGLVLLATAPLVTFALVDVAVPVVDVEPASVAPMGVDAGILPGENAPVAEGSGGSGVLGEATSTLGLRPPLAGASTWLDVLRPWVLIVWIAGASVFGLRLVCGLVGVWVLTSSGRALPERLVERVRRLRSAMGVSSSVVVAGSRRVTEAVAVGFVRPMVLVPTSWLARMPVEVLEAIVAHELAHVWRWDLWVNLFQRVVETLLFHHPVVWWLSGRVRTERELCCDELAVAATGKRADYARRSSSWHNNGSRRRPPSWPPVGEEDACRCSNV